MVVVVGHHTQCPDDNDAPVDLVSVQVQNISRVLLVSAFCGSSVLFVGWASCTPRPSRPRASCGRGAAAPPATRATARCPRRRPQFARRGACALGAGARVLMAACGSQHRVMLTNSGVVWTCGNGEHGALGHGTLDSCDVPTRIPQECFGWRQVASVAAGSNTSLQ